MVISCYLIIIIFIISLIYHKDYYYLLIYSKTILLLSPCTVASFDMCIIVKKYFVYCDINSEGPAIIIIVYLAIHGFRVIIIVLTLRRGGGGSWILVSTFQITSDVNMKKFDDTHLVLHANNISSGNILAWSTDMGVFILLGLSGRLEGNSIILDYRSGGHCLETSLPFFRRGHGRTNRLSCPNRF